jgi:hypothetical protein
MLSKAVENLIDAYRQSSDGQTDSQTETCIHVDEIAAKVARFYEKTRNIIDYQEEHLLRKGAIERALQQGLLFRGKEENIAESLIKKIIRAGHLPNDKIPERKISDVEHVIDNLLVLLNHVKDDPNLNSTEINNISEWLIQITASAIEEELAPPIRDRLTADLMLRDIRRRLVITGKELSQNDKDIQLFIAIQRAFLKSDINQINYRLLKFSYPNWNSLSETELVGVAKNLPTLKHNIDLYLKHPVGPIFFKLCNHYNTVFYLIGDVIFDENLPIEKIAPLFNDAEELGLKIRLAYKRRYQKAKRGLGRLAFFSVISIFLSKVIFALAIEIPIDKYITGHYSGFNTIINMIVPPVLMLLILSFIRLPSKKNWGLIMKEVRNVTSEKEAEEILLNISKKKNVVARYTARLIYFVISLGIFYGLALLLLNFSFSVANIAVFLLFTSLVAATGIKVHNRSKDLSLEKERHTFFAFMFDVLIMPFVTVGKVILAGLAKFKPLVIIINFIDLPFNILVQFIENLRDFIRTKKEEMY